MGTGMNSGGSDSRTGTRDVEYNLISIAYHSLQGADTMDDYIRDAEGSGDQELAQFFRDAQEQNRKLGNRAKELLRRAARGDGASGGGAAAGAGGR